MEGAVAIAVIASLVAGVLALLGGLAAACIWLIRDLIAHTVADDMED